MNRVTIGTLEGVREPGTWDPYGGGTDIQVSPLRNFIIPIECDAVILATDL